MSIHNRKSMHLNADMSHDTVDTDYKQTNGHNNNSTRKLTKTQLYEQLIDVVKHSNTDQAKTYIDTYSNIIDLTECCDTDGSTILHWCSWLNNAVLLQYILFQSSLHITAHNINAYNSRTESVLEWAIRSNSIEIFKLYVQYDVKYHCIDWNIVNVANATLLHIAVCEHNVDITQCLLLACNNINAVDTYSNTALHNAIQRQQHSQIKLLLQNNVITTILSQHNTSTLHLAALHGNTKLCNDLLKRGCTIHLNTLGTIDNLLPEQCAHNNGHTHLAKILRSKRYQQLTWLQYIKSYCNSDIQPQYSADHSNTQYNKPYVIKKPKTTFVQCYYFITLIGTMSHLYLSGIQTELSQFDNSILFRLLLLLLYICYIGAVVGMYAVSRIKPGYAPRNEQLYTTQYLMQAILNNEAVCMTCRIVRPIRSKHDNYENACVLRYDHWCPWVNNVIGLNNHRLFIVSLFIFNCTATLYSICAVYYIAIPGIIDQFENIRILIVLVVHATVINLAVLVLLVSQLYGIMSNLTTNENINSARYEYLFANKQSPFDEGAYNNCLVFWGYKLPRIVNIPFKTYLTDQLPDRRKQRKVFDSEYTAVNTNDTDVNDSSIEINHITSTDSLHQLDTVIDINKTS